MALFEFKESDKPYLEFIYWFIVFTIIAFLMTFHKPFVSTIDRSQMPIIQRFPMCFFVGAVYGSIIWLLNKLLKVIINKLYEQ